MQLIRTPLTFPWEFPCTVAALHLWGHASRPAPQFWNTKHKPTLGN